MCAPDKPMQIKRYKSTFMIIATAMFCKRVQRAQTPIDIDKTRPLFVCEKRKKKN